MQREICLNFAIYMAFFFLGITQNIKFRAKDKRVNQLRGIST